ncbi:hypothetical protein BKA61DRAFT_481616, partial [Leptodontidium sp. MPI-SDFR-AT-0119]
NSVVKLYNAEKKYTSFKFLISLILKYVNERYDRGPFKLVYNDLSLANLIVKSDDNLTIIGVVDFE